MRERIGTAIGLLAMVGVLAVAWAYAPRAGGPRTQSELVRQPTRHVDRRAIQPASPRPPPARARVDEDVVRARISTARGALDRCREARSGGASVPDPTSFALAIGPDGAVELAHSGLADDAFDACVAAALGAEPFPPGERITLQVPIPFPP